MKQKGNKHTINVQLSEFRQKSKMTTGVSQDEPAQQIAGIQVCVSKTGGKHCPHQPGVKRSPGAERSHMTQIGTFLLNATVDKLLQTRIEVED